jgi:hypothetical protein
MDHQRFARLNSHRVRSYTRTLDHADADVALAATSAVIELGDPLPEGAVVLGVIANVTEDWAVGGATFEADIGDGSDADKFTPTALDIDGGIALLTQAVFIPGGGDQLTLTITGSVNLSTLTSGIMALTVLFVDPDDKAA